MKITFPITEIVKEVSEKTLNEFEYEGKTILEWIEILKNYEDKKSTLERIIERLENASWWTQQTYDEDGYGNDDSDEVVYLDTAINIVMEEGGLE